MIAMLGCNLYDPLHNAVPLYNAVFLHEIFHLKNCVIEGDYCIVVVRGARDRPLVRS